MTQSMETMSRHAPLPCTGEHEPPTMRLHLWVETPEGVLFGMGRLILLHEIESTGSLTAAAAKLGMSYRGAWGKITRTENLLGHKLIDRSDCRRSGCKLTPYGQDLARRFRDWFEQVERFALDQGKALLPFQPKRYETS
ncbi:MAG: LysR family transcriptional regulator [Desulfovibrionaceae bacterium]